MSDEDLTTDRDDDATPPTPGRFGAFGGRYVPEALVPALEELDEAEAEVVRLYHLEGKSYREISARIGMPENSIGPTLSRAREKMRRPRSLDSRG